MTFTGRLRVFFAILVIVPMVAIAVVLFWLAGDSEQGKADAGIATGMSVALAAYGDGRTAARDELRAVAADPRLAAALTQGEAGAARDRLRTLRVVHPSIVAITIARPGGERLNAGSPDGVAAAEAEIVSRDGRRLGKLCVSVTSAKALAASIARHTRLELLVLRGGGLLASSEAGVVAAPPDSGDFKAVGHEYRGRRELAGRSLRAAEELVVFGERADANDAIADNRTLIAVTLLAFLIVALISSIIVIHELRAQVGAVLSAARRLAAGKLEHPVPVEGEDEFAQIGREFNALSAKLNEKIEEVERSRVELESTIRRVGKAFAAGLDPQGIFDLTVQTAVDACVAESGRALPLDLRVVKETRVGARDGDLEAALTHAERRAGGELLESAGESHRPEPTAVEHDGVHALSLQLRARLAREKPHFIGLISIARRGRPFSFREADMLRYLAGQAVVSIENADLHDTVQRQARTDALTGLANSRELHGALDRELERLRRFDVPLAFVLLDIDDFKKINDTYGHQQGDDVLARVADVLRDHTRDIDEPARYGGEEMAVVMPQTDVAGASLLAERMREAIDDLRIPLIDGDGVLRTTASFGVAAVPASATDKSSLISAADAALYRAKRGGKNRVERALTETVNS